MTGYVESISLLILNRSVVQVDLVLYPDGTKYVGGWENAFRNGPGVLYRTDGEKCAGVWNEDKLVGRSLRFGSHGERYEGEFGKGEIRHGEGTQHFPNGDVYAGQWVNGMREGIGTFAHQNGDVYTGPFTNDKKDGIGAYYYADGDRYEGAFVEGVKTGKGSYYYDNGNQYIGEWLDDKKHGSGKYTYAAGALAGVEYDGQWKDGVRHGRGTVTYADGTVFEGHFEVPSRLPRLSKLKWQCKTSLFALHDEPDRVHNHVCMMNMPEDDDGAHCPERLRRRPRSPPHSGWRRLLRGVAPGQEGRPRGVSL